MSWVKSCLIEGLSPGWSLFVGLADPWPFLLHFPPGCVGHSLALINAVESAGSLATHRGLGVCVWDCWGWGGENILSPPCSLKGHHSFRSREWCQYQHWDSFSITGFLESKGNVDRYFAVTGHFCKLRALGPNNSGFPEGLSESQEDICHEPLGGLISILSNSHDCQEIYVGNLIISPWALVSLSVKWVTGGIKWNFIEIHI